MPVETRNYKCWTLLLRNKPKTLYSYILLGLQGFQYGLNNLDLQQTNQHMALDKPQGHLEKK